MMCPIALHADGIWPHGSVRESTICLQHARIRAAQKHCRLFSLLTAKINTNQFSLGIICVSIMDSFNQAPSRWIECPPYGEVVEDIFLPSKTFLQDVELPPGYEYTPKIFLDQMRERKIDVGLIINLTFSQRYYEGDEIQEQFNVAYKQISCRGHNEAPKPSERAEFMRVCNNFIRTNPRKIIAVHCTHGFNRTGFMICYYLCKEFDWDIAAALEIFKSKRQPGIYKQDYINELYNEFGDSDDPIARAPERPSWDTDEGIIDPNITLSSTDPNISSAVLFYEGIQDVELVRDIELKRKIYNRCCQLCKLDAKPDHITFPGAQPVSMDRTNIKLLKDHKYRVSWKADGCRFMLYIQDEDNIFFLTRSLQLWRVTGLLFPRIEDIKSHLTDTLLDGEMVTDVRDGQSFPTYLIYDVISLNGKIVANDHFDKRCWLIRAVIVEARKKARRANMIPNETKPFVVCEKGFYHIHKAKKTLELRVPHEKDGLIFQPLNAPYTGGTCTNILKWKPPELNSIDFLMVVREVRENGCLPECVAQLYVSNVKDRPLIQFKLSRDRADYRQYNNKIVEVIFKDRRWIVLRERTDKLRPNTYDTAMSVMKSIKEPVSEQNLLEFIASIPPEQANG